MNLWKEATALARALRKCIYVVSVATSAFWAAFVLLTLACGVLPRPEHVAVVLALSATWGILAIATKEGGE